MAKTNIPFPPRSPEYNREYYQTILKPARANNPSLQYLKDLHNKVAWYNKQLMNLQRKLYAYKQDIQAVTEEITRAKNEKELNHEVERRTLNLLHTTIGKGKKKDREKDLSSENRVAG